MSAVWLAFGCGCLLGGSVGFIIMGLMAMAAEQSRAEEARRAKPLPLPSMPEQSDIIANAPLYWGDQL